MKMKKHKIGGTQDKNGGYHGWRDYVRGQDLFGHEMNIITFENQRNTYKTCQGGSASIGVKMFLLAYFCLNLVQIISPERNTMYSWS